MAKRAIVILHGWTKNYRLLNPLKNILQGKGYEVFCPVLPGFGKKTLKSPWKLENYTVWLKEYLKVKKINEFNLVGHSNGGRVALAFASQQQPNLKSLILISSAGIRQQFNLKRAIFWLLAKIGKPLFCLPILQSISARCRQYLYKIANASDYYKADPKLAKTMVNLLNLDLSHSLAKIKIKTLLLWGLNDETTPLENGLLMFRKINGAKLTLFPDSDHTLPYQRPKKVAKEINNFLNNKYAL